MFFTSYQQLHHHSTCGIELCLLEGAGPSSALGYSKVYKLPKWYLLFRYGHGVYEPKGLLVHYLPSFSRSLLRQRCRIAEPPENKATVVNYACL